MMELENICKAKISSMKEKICSKCLKISSAKIFKWNFMSRIVMQSCDNLKWIKINVPWNYEALKDQ